MVFLDIKKKAWVIEKLEIPVIEDIPMKDLEWFTKANRESLEKGDSITPLEAMDFDEAWWDKTCEIGLGTTKEKIIETGITSPKFRELMAEVYTFLVAFGTVEEAKLSPLYQVLTRKKDKKP